MGRTRTGTSPPRTAGTHVSSNASNAAATAIAGDPTCATTPTTATAAGTSATTTATVRGAARQAGDGAGDGTTAHGRCTGAQLHISTMRSRGFARSLRVCPWMGATCSPRSARSTRVPFGASRLASGGGLHVSRVFRVLQHPIKTEPEEESSAPVDPPQGPEAAEEESAGAAQSNAEMGEQPPEEAAAAGEEMEKDEIVQI